MMNSILVARSKKYRGLVNAIEVLVTKPLIFNNAPFKIERACVLLYLLHLSFIVSFRASALQFEDNAPVSYKVLEGDEITIGCSMTEPPYYKFLQRKASQLAFPHPQWPPLPCTLNCKGLQLNAPWPDVTRYLHWSFLTTEYLISFIFHDGAIKVLG